MKFNIVIVLCLWYLIKCRMDGKFIIEVYLILVKSIFFNLIREEYMYI